MPSASDMQIIGEAEHQNIISTTRQFMHLVQSKGIRHVIGPTYYDVIEFALGNKRKIHDVIMTSLFYHVTTRSASLQYWNHYY